MTSSNEIVRSRSGRRFKKVVSTPDGTFLPHPPPRRPSNAPSTLPTVVNRDGVIAARSSSSLLRLNSKKSDVPILISRSSKHRLGARQPLPPIPPATPLYKDTYPLTDPPPREGFVDIAVRLIDGERIERRFSLADPLGCVLAFVEAHTNERLESPCELVPNGMTSQTLKPEQMRLSLETLGIRNRTLFYLQLMNDD
ncbi:uncharacterized protein [Oscarella lobularis]|uniref:uncharacterized protein n=1 Tax=Oscarella lobularis TaxID=121494 RepID=UPI00331316FF